MGFQQYKILFLVIIAVTSLITATPAIQYAIAVPQTEKLTEFSVLGPYHNATYPANITSSQNLQLYFDVNNELGTITYYQIQVKFRNEHQSAPDSFNHTNSDLPALGSIDFFSANKQTIELPVDISFEYNIDPNNSTQINMQSMTLNGVTLNASEEAIPYNPEKACFLGNLFFELWIYNNTSNMFQHNQRYLSLWLQMNP